MENTNFTIAVYPGDGIGTEIMATAEAVLQAVQEKVGGFSLALNSYSAGAAHYEKHGEDISPADFNAGGDADAILLGAMGLPNVRYPDGTEIAPHLRMRTAFELYAGLRPVKTFPNAPGPLGSPRASEIDLVIVRESTEGLFASLNGGSRVTETEASETLTLTRSVCERLFDQSFRLAQARKVKGGKGELTCVDKSNVFPAFAFFRRIFDERAAAFPDIQRRYSYVDAMALDLVRKPWEFDVLVTENMFGDILSDLGAGIVGSMGLAPCAELGDRHGLFQPAHGSAPDIAGQGVANPTAMILSAAMMLDWLARQHDVPACADAAGRIAAAVQQGFAEKAIRPFEFDGDTGTREIGEAVIARLG
ncbi:MAG TPA: isocitrate/isopropylmalate family dehydrogenase [Alphaproteobacteria bacterium]|nr:isocitrate/isopropylmalate family dehydrogenase [Alphaproteobacteria bacterium]